MKSIDSTVMEIWLRTNPRPFLAALVLPIALLLGGFAWIWLVPRTDGAATWVDNLGWGLVAASFFMGGLLLWRSKSPVLARRKAELLLFLGGAPPITIPISIVECFFVGQSEAMIGGRKGKEVEATAIIFRLAENAREWHQRDVSARYAHWCEGYITLRGTWCQPIGPELMRQLNQRLIAAQRELNSAKQ
jgi:hypothetical protein